MASAGSAENIRDDLNGLDKAMFLLAKSYSSAGKRTEAYALFCHARTLTDSALQKLANSPDKALIQELKSLSDNCRSNSCIEHATSIMEEEKVPSELSKGVSTMSLGDDKTKENKYLLDMLQSYESAIGEQTPKSISHRSIPTSLPSSAMQSNRARHGIQRDRIPKPREPNEERKEGSPEQFWG
ncbi:hypothetical protein HU200_033439 [Digitaria exilis]|uniref:Uncharacterized protein n=1 Tax=Digitaria exilis TaxID=1010633 RepID=A0A835BLE0_9POAL|nr:hypothetical protein HU200_033439 [Digitaria exilis]